MVLTTLLAVAAAGAFFWWPRAGAEDPGRSGANGGEPVAVPSRTVAAGRSYYVLLSLVEASPRKANGKRWDGDGSAPDLVYTVDWQDQEVFESSKKPDTLVAKWSNVAVDWKDLVNEVSLDDSIRAARVTVRPGQKLRFRVVDADVFRDDPVGAWEMPATDLRIGDQVLDEPGGRLVQVHCRVLPLDRVEFESLVR